MIASHRAALLTAKIVRETYPLRYVRVKPYTAIGMVQMQRGRGPWRVYTVFDALVTKREWRQRTIRKRKPPTKVTR